MLRVPLIALTFAAAALVAGCGSDDGGDSTDPAVMKENFEERAAAAYEAEGVNREEDFARGVIPEECIILDQEGADAIAAALGEDGAEIAASSFVAGEPGENESASCTLVGPDGLALAAVNAGTTAVDRDQLLANLERIAVVLKGEAPGLSPDEVVAVDQQKAGRRFAWISDGFIVGVSGPHNQVTAAEGFEALSVAVDEVARTLSD